MSNFVIVQTFMDVMIDFTNDSVGPTAICGMFEGKICGKVTERTRTIVGENLIKTLTLVRTYRNQGNRFFT